MSNANSKGYRKTNARDEILNVIRESFVSEDVYLWQNLDGIRIQHPIMLRDFDPIEEKLTVEFRESPYRFRFHEDVYVKLPFKDSGFKAKSLMQNDRELVLHLPLVMVMREMRTEPRHNFLPTDERRASIARWVEADAVYQTRPFNVTILNASKGGLCLLMSATQAKVFQDGGPISIRALDGMPFTIPIRGTISFLEEIKRRGTFGNESGVRLGVKAEKPFPESVFQAFLKAGHRVRIEDERLLHDKDFRDSVEHRTKRILGELSRKKSLTTLIAAMSIDREDNQYLRNHIQLLCEVSCGIAKSLNWVTEMSLEKLIYVSYLHDIRYAEHPHLARIPSLADFDARKPALSEAERKIYLEGPVYAARLASEDLRAFPDAERILRQHKELPDGTGYPDGIRYAKFHPLTCVFIVAHRFVDYVIDNRDWKYSEFIEQNKSKLTGMHFTKIMAVFEKLA